uniref:Uncharacterized protein n=1 Tax=Ixodes scapularis TaxID=6945 RepID=A0A4D5RF97_IXOSC
MLSSTLSHCSFFGLFEQASSQVCADLFKLCLNSLHCRKVHSYCLQVPNNAESVLFAVVGVIVPQSFKWLHLNFKGSIHRWILIASRSGCAIVY